MTLYSAIKDVVADENVELKRPQTITPDSPRMHILYARAKEREDHFNVVLGGRLEDLTMKEFAAIYPVMKAEAAAGYPDFKNLYGPFETCDQQQKWLQEQGIEFNAQF
ncbi:hypothetical protein GCM10007924_23300 [Sneathiella chinensis]|uniref:Uncharacterized protein n=2 Tax=Sneathiella chinensis TaxID=349750 RepID=A0ABQ5U5C4_9PROT|nr:hypothetical protein GCM10007924_23300 [Sneathiella chinensis]